MCLLSVSRKPVDVHGKLIIYGHFEALSTDSSMIACYQKTGDPWPGFQEVGDLQIREPS
jgi:hypothetical protein